jgi:hypothetical protein
LELKPGLGSERPARTLAGAGGGGEACYVGTKEMHIFVICLNVSMIIDEG